jgi:uncharacterized membrane protein (Fun14 family)
MGIAILLGILGIAAVIGFAILYAVAVLAMIVLAAVYAVVFAALYFLLGETNVGWALILALPLSLLGLVAFNNVADK